ncbi:MAG TPA: hypothetical protein VFI06_17240 [Chitinophagaceae bacterium]|nr:hypothetical protein [Chitinophagaceae bacterium]
MLDIVEKDLRQYFHENANRLTNEKGVSITIGDGELFLIQYTLEEDTKHELHYQLYDEVKGIREFMHAYQAYAVSELRCIDESYLWYRWAHERAELIFTSPNYCNFYFRKFRGKVIVYSPELNWYREVKERMEELQDFKRYVAQRNFFKNVPEYSLES